MLCVRPCSELRDPLDSVCYTSGWECTVRSRTSQEYSSANGYVEETLGVSVDRSHTV